MNKLQNQISTTMVNENYEIKNEEFKDIINKICSSEKYTNIISLILLYYFKFIFLNFKVFLILRQFFKIQPE